MSWKEEEIEILRENINRDYEKLIKLLPNRTLSSIITKKDRLKIKRISNFYWSKKQDNYLIKNYHKVTINELSTILGKSFGAIHARRIRLIKSGIKFKNKKEFFSKYWKNEYKNNYLLIDKHSKSIKKFWKDENFRNKHRMSIQEKFKDKDYLEKHKTLFIKRRNSKEFRLKQSLIASKTLKKRHSNIEEHKKMLLNLRKNPSNKQLIAFNYLKKLFGEENVGCNDWKILNGLMEVDIPIYSKKIAIEWDGEYWHKNNIVRDNKKEKLLNNIGWKLIRIKARSNPQLKEYEIIELINKNIKIN